MYDLIVIGAGWAGFNAAIKARDLGLKVALVEKRQVGGTCLNRGCIPTKALIHSAKAYSLTKKSVAFGIDLSVPAEPNFLKIQERKDKILQQLQAGMQFMLKGIEFFNASAEIISAEEVKIGAESVKTKSIIIAAGSRPFELPALKFDGKKIVSSDDILNLKEIPKSLLIVGGGVIGCEFASLFSALGTQVSVVEKMPQILPGIDKEIVRRLEVLYKKKGIKVSVDTDATTLDLNQYDLVLVCIGRVPDLAGLGLERAGIKTERNRIIVDDYLRTNIPNIYAAGDCTGKIMLAHYASYQGSIAAENIAGPDNLKAASNNVVPSCIFTDPEIATVGITEDEALKRGLEVKINRFDFRGSGMARILDEAEGLIKVIVLKNSEEIIGASIIGPKATELIAVLTLAQSTKLKVSQIKETIFAHPTLSESIHEALSA